MKQNKLFINKLIKLGYEPAKSEWVYKYLHTHGTMWVSFADNSTMVIYWKPLDEKKIIHYYGYIPQTANEIKVIVKLLRLKI